MTNHCADKSDELGEQCGIARPGFVDYGGYRAFEGRASTVRCFEDNSLVREAAGQPGEGRVLVVDGGASMNCALLGDKLARLAYENDWAGIVINGCIRDSAVIADMPIGVKALATHPKKSEKRGSGERDVAVHFAGVVIKPGDYIYCDSDGILVCADSLPDDVTALQSRGWRDKR